jgi:hypothetical protein
MNELEIKEKSTVIYQLSQEVSVQNQDDLKRATEVLKGVKNHRAKIIEYWKTAKESTKKAYQEIVSKEKQMLGICDKVEKNLKSEILSHKSTQERNALKLSAEAEQYRNQEVEKLLNESIEAQESGDEETAKSKLRQAELIENLESFTSKIFQSPNGITTQKRWQCRITDNKLVPAFSNGFEIREISTKQILELRKINPKIKIPGVEFYQSENIVIRN